MTDAFLEFLKTNGTPAWAVVLIAAGTIVAAIITAINSLIVAALQAFTSRRLAIDAAHRQYRTEMCAPVLKRARRTAKVAQRIVYGPIPTHDDAELGTFAAQLAETLQSIGSEIALLTGDDVMDGAIDQLVGSTDSLLASLLNVSDAAPIPEWDTATLGSITKTHMQIALGVARHTQACCFLFEIAAEAYIYSVGHARRRARQTLKKLKAAHISIERDPRLKKLQATKTAEAK